MKAASATAVIERFADEYARGRTPVPCISCNQGVKFADLIGFARELGADCLATGHYVRRVVGANGAGAAPRRRSGPRPELFPVRDDARRSSISCAFRLGDMPKARGARDRARARPDRSPTSPTARTSASSPTAIMRGSSRRCGPRRRGRARSSIATAGCSGAHRGLIHFTVGQRRGLEIGGQAEPLYVVRLEPETARVVVGPKARARGARARGSKASTGSARASATV